MQIELLIFVYVRSIDQNDRLKSSPGRVEMDLLHDQSSPTGVSAVRNCHGVVTLDVQLQVKTRIVTSVSGTVVFEDPYVCGSSGKPDVNARQVLHM
jgi:hypothetical protein